MEAKILNLKKIGAKVLLFNNDNTAKLSIFKGLQHHEVSIKEDEPNQEFEMAKHKFVIEYSQNTISVTAFNKAKEEADFVMFNTSSVSEEAKEEKPKKKKDGK